MSLSQSDRKWINGPTPRRKRRRQTVYVLTGSYQYENTVVIGVYSTRKRAEKAREVNSAERTTTYDYYSIDGVVVNA